VRNLWIKTGLLTYPIRRWPLTRIAVLQPSTFGKGLEMTREALERGSNVVLLPEKWTEEFNLDQFISLSRLFNNSIIIPGAFEDQGRNSAYIIHNGKIVGKVSKSHLFSTERDRIQSGEGPTVLDYKGIRFGVAICYDVNFPELVRELIKSGADVLLVPGKVKWKAIDMWLIYLRARALENRIPVFSSMAYDEQEFLGGSSILVPIINEFVELRELHLGNKKDSYIIYDINDELIYNLRKLRRERILELRSYKVNEVKI